MAWRPPPGKRFLDQMRVLVLEPGERPRMIEQHWNEKALPIYLGGRCKRAPAGHGLWLDEGWWRKDGGTNEPNPIATAMLELRKGEIVFGTCVVAGYDPQLEEVISVSSAATVWALKAWQKLGEGASSAHG